MKKVIFSSKPTGSHLQSDADAWVNGKAVSAEPTKRLTVDIALPLHLRIKSQCALHDRLISDVVREILEKHFGEEYEGEAPSRLSTHSDDTEM